MANDVNKVVIVGRLTRDCGSDPNGKDFQYTQGGMCIARVSIAVNRSQKQNEQWVDVASFFNVTIFGKIAENLKPYLTKGKQIVVDGHLQQDKWTDQQGVNHTSVSIVADNIELVGGQPQNGQQGGYTQAPQQNFQQPQKPANSFNPQALPQYQQRPQQTAPQNYPQQSCVPPADGGFPEDIPF